MLRLECQTAFAASPYLISGPQADIVLPSQELNLAYYTQLYDPKIDTRLIAAVDNGGIIFSLEFVENEWKARQDEFNEQGIVCPVFGALDYVTFVENGSLLKVTFSGPNTPYKLTDAGAPSILREMCCT